MSKGFDGIQIFARVKPCKKPFRGAQVSHPEGDSPRFTVAIPRDEASGFVNNKKETYGFKFRHIFPQDCQQSDVFDVVAKPVVTSVLDGYNGTIFAYGQTGSGKTFTITGGPERYEDRGIIPRVLTYIFEQFASRGDRVFEASVSYLEIYNDSGYDLLDPNHEITKMEDLPKVELLDSGGGDVLLKNLSQNAVSSEEDALEKLFVGDTNRMIAETPMNMASTRSHCVFTIHITSRSAGGALIRRSKLHLVDLAGSERIGKTGVVGNLATEAKYINLSLHYLEQVIVALSDKSRSHVPYRNSMMTSVLRDSLGGNCKTTMIATLNTARPNIDETISTCRFAQRVALIQNSATLNEEADPRLMISKLKGEVERLKAELALAGGGEDADAGPLEAEEILRCRQLVKTYVEDSSEDAMITLGDLRKIEACFRIFKDMVLDRPPSLASAPSPALAPVPVKPPTPELAAPSFSQQQADERAAKLEELLRQRDNEIGILIAKIKRNKGKASSRTGGGAAEPGAGAGAGAAMPDDRPSSRPASRQRSGRSSRAAPANAGGGSAHAAVAPGQAAELSPAEREAAYEQFKRVYPDYPGISTNKQTLKQRYAQAKSLGGLVNECRANINTIKAKIERIRLEAGVDQLSETPGMPSLNDADQSLRDELQSEKTRYKGLLGQLKSLKGEIEHMQHLLQNSKVKLQRDFETWLAEQAAEPRRQSQPQPAAATPEPPRRSQDVQAWRTPPRTSQTSPAAGFGSADELLSMNNMRTLQDIAPSKNRGGGGRGGGGGGSGSRRMATPGGDARNVVPVHRGALNRSDRSMAPPPAPAHQTGNSSTDDDIAAFFSARDRIRKR